MRIITGTAKGMKLKTPRGKDVRPTSDRVREALFSIISHHLAGAIFFDLYAGSGAVGIEALSRGTEKSVFVDYKRENISLIKENLAKAGLSENAVVIKDDAEKTILKLGRENFKAGLIFLDPPYSFTRMNEVINKIITCRVVEQHGLIIVEHNYHNRQWTDKYPEARQKRYGDTCLTFIEPGSLTQFGQNFF